MCTINIYIKNNNNNYDILSSNKLHARKFPGTCLRSVSTPIKIGIQMFVIR